MTESQSPLEIAEPPIERIAGKDMIPAIAEKTGGQAISLSDAARILQEEQQRIERACWEEIGAALNKYGRRLDASLTVSGRGNQFSIHLAPA